MHERFYGRCISGLSSCMLLEDCSKCSFFFEKCKRILMTVLFKYSLVRVCSAKSDKYSLMCNVSVFPLSRSGLWFSRLCQWKSGNWTRDCWAWCSWKEGKSRSFSLFAFLGVCSLSAISFRSFNLYIIRDGVSCLLYQLPPLSIMLLSSLPEHTRCIRGHHYYILLSFLSVVHKQRNCHLLVRVLPETLSYFRSFVAWHDDVRFIFQSS